MIKCPVCGKYKFAADNDFDVCEVCSWENDGVQFDDPDYAGGANWLSVNQAKTNYKEHGVIMTEKDKTEREAFYKAHVALDGKWID